MADALKFTEVLFTEEYDSFGHHQNKSTPARVRATARNVTVTAEGPERSFVLRAACYSLLSQQLEEKS